MQNVMDNETLTLLNLPYLFVYKPISAISRDPKLLAIRTCCKVIPRGTYGIQCWLPHLFNHLLPHPLACQSCLDPFVGHD